DAAAFAESMHREQEAAFEEAAEEMIQGSPLRFLTRMQQALVLGAHDLYELLDVSPAASFDELRTAYRTRCKEVHPDIQTGNARATEDMVELTNAWEILRSERMREAY